MREQALWIGGEERRGARRFEVRCPYNGAVVARVEEAGEAEMGAALEAAWRGARAMAAMTRAGRAAILRAARERLLERREEFARLVSEESGKPLREARLEVERAAGTLLFSAEEAHRLAGEEVPMDALEAGAGRMAMTLRVPVGVIGCITPFNFPLNLSVHKIGPALGAGNAVVHKPASATPSCALELAKLLHECGLPAGALNVVPGPGRVVGEALVEARAVRMITFTGSAEVGLRIRARAGMKKVTLELGNSSALIVDRDADLDEAVARAVAGSYANSGQVCISVQRIFVHEEIARAFTDRFGAAALALRSGPPLEEATEISSMINEEEAMRVEEWGREAVMAGARLLVGGRREGSRTAPTVLAGVAEGARVFREEVFGPIACINRWSDFEDVLERVNASEYGLQAGYFTRDLKRAFEAARRVEVGGFLINDVPAYRLDQMPYGGVKLSGSGREGPRYAMEEMTERRLVSWR